MIYQGAEAALVPWYAANLSARVVTETPSDLADQVPLARLVGVGGAASPSLPNRLRIIRWAVQCFAVGSLAALELAEEAAELTLGPLRGASLLGADVTMTTLESAPAWVPYADTVLRQYSATYNATVLLH